MSCRRLAGSNWKGLKPISFLCSVLTAPNSLCQFKYYYYISCILRSSFLVIYLYILRNIHLLLIYSSSFFLSFFFSILVPRELSALGFGVNRKKNFIWLFNIVNNSSLFLPYKAWTNGWRVPLYCGGIFCFKETHMYS